MPRRATQMLDIESWEEKLEAPPAIMPDEDASPQSVVGSPFVALPRFLPTHFTAPKRPTCTRG